MNNLESSVQHIKSKEDFLEFLEALNQDFKNNIGTWENKTIDSFIEAMQSWVEDMDGYYINTKQPIPKDLNWKVFADILIASKMYE